MYAKDVGGEKVGRRQRKPQDTLWQRGEQIISTGWTGKNTRASRADIPPAA
jgi:hypothetical protein